MAKKIKRPAFPKRKFKDGRTIVKGGGNGSFPIEPNATSHSGKVVDPKTGETGTFALQSFGGPLDLDRGLAEEANDEFDTSQDRRWDIRAIFAFGRDEAGESCRRKQVGLFFMRPGAPTKVEVQSILELSGVDNRVLRLKEVQQEARRLTAREYFVLESNPDHTGLEVINRDTLVDFLLKYWRKEPISTMGNIQLYYEHIRINIDREHLLKSSTREELFRHINDIFELMDKNFKYDPWASKGREGALRRIDEKGVGSWAAKRN